MPEDSKAAFSHAVGHIFQVQSIDDTGCLEIDMWPKVSLDTIWLEPFCANRTRRYKTLSKAFLKRQEQAAAPSPPRYVLEFEITLNPNIDCEEFGLNLLGMSTGGGGLAAWPDERRIKGSVYANIAEGNPVEILESARSHALESDKVQAASFSPIHLDKET